MSAHGLGNRICSRKPFIHLRARTTCDLCRQSRCRDSNTLRHAQNGSDHVHLFHMRNDGLYSRFHPRTRLLHNAYHRLASWCLRLSYHLDMYGVSLRSHSRMPVPILPDLMDTYDFGTSDMFRDCLQKSQKPVSDSRNSIEQLSAADNSKTLRLYLCYRALIDIHIN